MVRHFDFVVVGRGMMGAAAARHLAKTGASVALVGRGEPADWKAHDGVFSSHYDSGRITRTIDVFARLVGFFGRAGYNIIDAKIHTTRLGYALDSFMLLDVSGRDSDRSMITYIEHELTERLTRQIPPEAPGSGITSAPSGTDQADASASGNPTR